MYPWCFQWHSVTAQKVPRWFHDSLGIMCPWLIWWVWCWHGNVVERLWKSEDVNILKGRVGVEWVEWGHVAAESTGEHRRMIGKKFHITHPHQWQKNWRIGKLKRQMDETFFSSKERTIFQEIWTYNDSMRNSDISGCGTCQHFKIDRSPAKLTRPFANCSMDLITDLPLVDRHNSILVM